MRSSTHYTDKKRKTMRTQNIQSTNALIEGRGTPEDLSQSNKYINLQPLWRLDYEIRPFLLSPIVEEANGCKTQTMAPSKRTNAKRQTRQVLYVFFGFSIYSVV
jgi:hypothetical protein